MADVHFDDQYLMSFGSLPYKQLQLATNQHAGSKQAVKYGSARLVGFEFDVPHHKVLCELAAVQCSGCTAKVVENFLPE